MLDDLDEWPKVSDRLVIDGELWRVVDAKRSYLCEREPDRKGATYRFVTLGHAMS